MTDIAIRPDIAMATRIPFMGPSGTTSAKFSFEYNCTLKMARDRISANVSRGQLDVGPTISTVAAIDQLLQRACNRQVNT